MTTEVPPWCVTELAEGLVNYATLCASLTEAIRTARRATGLGYDVEIFYGIQADEWKLTLLMDRFTTTPRRVTA